MKFRRLIAMVLATVTAVSLCACDDTSPLPQKELKELFSGYQLIVGEEKHNVLKAADAFDAFIKGHLEKQTKADDKTLTVNIGIDAKLDGYTISQHGNTVNLSGSTADYTYIAVSRYINQLMQNDAKNISTVNKNGLSVTYEAPTREQYINDISLLETVWQYEWAPPEWMLDFGEKVLTVLDKSARPICYGHRGDVQHYPENSIEGIISAIKKGADLVEVDVYITKDGVPVLNHGADLSITTDWSQKRGKTIDGVELPNNAILTQWTYEQLSKLNLRTGNGEYTNAASEITSYKIPTLKEVFTVCNNRCFILIDKMTSDQWDIVFDIMKQTGNCKSFIYTDMAKSKAEADAMQAKVRAEFGDAAPTLYTRGMCWSGTWFDEFSLTTDEEFEQYYAAQIKIGEYVSTNRVCKLVDYIAKHYKSTRDKYK